MERFRERVEVFVYLRSKTNHNGLKSICELFCNELLITKKNIIKNEQRIKLFCMFAALKYKTLSVAPE